MKPSLFLIFTLLLVITSLAQTQDWRPIRTDDTYFYFGNNEYRAYRIDSIQEFPDSIIMFSYPELFAFEYSDCFNPFGPSWIGKRIACHNNKTTFYNNLDEPINLLKTTEIGTKWHLYDYSETRFIQAEIIDKTYENIGYADDSVVKISITSDDGLNGSLITISKNHGMVQGFNFLFFPNLTTEFQELENYTLSGQVSNTTSKANLTVFDIYNFDVGDEFQTDEFSYSYFESGIQGESVKTRKVVLDKLFNSDSSEVSYTFQVCNKNGETTLQETYSTKLDILNELPYTPMITDFYGWIDLIFNKMGNDSNGIRYKNFGGGFGYDSDSCYHWIFYDKKTSEMNLDIPFPYQKGIYYEGLGGPYFSFYGMGGESGFVLYYYKKGNIEWGTPLTCEQLLTSIKNEQELFIKVYPNPANNQITIETSVFKESAEIVFLDLFGKVCIKTALTEKVQEVDISNLSQGIYVYQIFDQVECLKTGKMVKN